MQITVNIPDKLAAEVKSQLATEAEAAGLTLEDYLVEKLVGTRAPGQAGRHSVDEAVANIRKLRKGNFLGGMTIKDLVHEGHRY